MKNEKSVLYMAKYADKEWLELLKNEIVTWQARNFFRRNYTLKELKK